MLCAIILSVMVPMFLLADYNLPNLWVYWIGPLMALVDWRKSFATKWGKKGKQENKKWELSSRKTKNSS
jgi:hypothetical protein